MTSSRPNFAPSPPPVQQQGQQQQIVIETARVILRGARLSDAEDLFECFSDPEVMLYWESLPHTDVATTRSWLGKMINGKNNGVTDFVICLKPVNDHSTSGLNGLAADPKIPMKVIGKVGIWHDDEIGFLLNRAYWRRGLACEVLTEVIDLAFNLRNTLPHATDSNGLAVSRNTIRDDIVADVDPRNTPSLGILRKLGFEVYATKEKTFKVGGEWVDSVYLRLLKDRWIAKR